MAEADWALIPAPGLDTTDVPRGVTNGLTRPAHSGTNNFCFAYRAATSGAGFAGYTCDVSGVNPTGAGKGGSMRIALKRYSANATYAPMFGLIKAASPIGEGYMLGLSEATGYQIALKKGAPSGGLDASGSDILRLSTQSYSDVGDAADVWIHLRLDVLVNPHNDVVLNVYENDLSTYDVDTPTWTAIDGMAQFIDDSVGVLTGSLPHTGPFYFFFGMYCEAAGSMCAFDHAQVYLQTSP